MTEHATPSRRPAPVLLRTAMPTAGGTYVLDAQGEVHPAPEPTAAREPDKEE